MIYMVRLHRNAERMQASKRANVRKLRRKPPKVRRVANFLKDVLVGVRPFGAAGP